MTDPSFPDKDPDCLGDTVFKLTRDDEKPAMSIEDKEILKIMDAEFHRDAKGNWTAPLPFRSPQPRLPNNKPQAEQRAQALDYSLKRHPLKSEHFQIFMQKIFQNGHAEPAPPLQNNEESWYLPIFGIYHPKKKDQIRAVFDSSAQSEGISLNSILLRGPDLINSLLGVFLRFRKEPIAITADIQQMSHCFYVREDHRNYLRFLWYRNNDFNNELVEYRMRVHVFGNSPSPAVATYGLRRAAREGEAKLGSDVREFVERNFYVDDGFASLPTSDAAVDLMRRTQQSLLLNGNLRLHKIASNCSDVMKAFPPDDRSKDLKDLDLGTDSVPLQRSLELAWDLKSDTFTFRVSSPCKSFTRRGILSTINSLFDPIGFLAPVLIQGKVLLRNLITEPVDWDEHLPAGKLQDWETWRNSLHLLENLQIPRTYTSSVSASVSKELHIFSDASEKAIATVAYLRTTDQNGHCRLGFVLGKAKVAPTHSHTIPRLELCAAVLAVEMFEMIEDNLDTNLDLVKFYTDSRVVLGYIHNKTRRFYVYVGNRVERIRKSSAPSKWNSIPSDLNQADQGTRSIPASDIGDSTWLRGPLHLLQNNSATAFETYPLANPDEDSELRPQVISLATRTERRSTLGSGRFERFSSWKGLVRAIALLQHVARTFHNKGDNINCKGWHHCSQYHSVSSYTKAENFIIQQVQLEFYGKELDSIKTNINLQRDSSLLRLNPILDDSDILRIGGRLNRANLPLQEKNPIIIPGKSQLSTLLIRHYHENVQHQGRHFTEGAIRGAGYWVTGSKRLISSLIYKCVKCRKLRGKMEHQRMSDLPTDRLTPSPPFSFVGVDMFGHWQIVTRRTRGHHSNSKRWAIMFTCLTTRSIHIEVVEDMSTSSFINALRRFISIRGPVIEFRSDRGTNFIGTVNELNMESLLDEDGPIKPFLNDKRTKWVFNLPHSSHMGGSWERMIGVTRRILDSMLLDIKHKNLSHDVLVTLFAEVCAIVNGRPLVPVSSDQDQPFILSPSNLLTQKTHTHHESLAPVDTRDLYKSQWKCVQCLADTFWNRWRKEYLQSLQPRRKWTELRPNLKLGDVVSLKDSSVHRNEWPVGIVEQTIPGEDNTVRKVVLRIVRDGVPTRYTRPVTETVLLISDT